MKISPTLVEISLMGILALISSSQCFAFPGNSTTNNPFADIAERNVFGLRPLPKLEPLEPPKLPVNIKLTGFEKHGTQGTRVLLAEVPKDPKEQMKLYNLGVGEMEDGVELVKIHPGQDAVDVVIDGVPEELTVKSNSFLTGLYDKGPMPKTGVRR